MEAKDKTLKEIFSDLENAELEETLGDLPNDKQPWSPTPLQSLDVDPTQWDCFNESLDLVDLIIPTTTNNDTSTTLTTTNTTNTTNNANNNVNNANNIELSSMETTSDRCSSIASSDAVAGAGGGEVVAEKAPRKRKGKAAAKRDDSEAPPGWLPAGWVVERKERTSGRTAGAVDKYYYDPEKKRSFDRRLRCFATLVWGLMATNHEEINHLRKKALLQVWIRKARGIELA
ncbi:hypothetical protein Syun_002623 [Stephania yunnanensis]|uniref:MBD domain-containing protein n=1 Tax=Stephania yunnanensis TaxID=152371 RepID=A0AAP0Q874_9MAGN